MLRASAALLALVTLPAAALACSPPPPPQSAVTSQLVLAQRRLLSARPADGARRNTLGLLSQYTAAGVFPRNTYAPGARTIFVDAQGRRSALAFLIEDTGRPRLVERIAETKNHAPAGELARDPEFAAALAELGLDVAEAQLLQPLHAFEGPTPAPGEPVVMRCGTSARPPIMRCGTRDESRVEGRFEVADLFKMAGLTFAVALVLYGTKQISI